jgi:hypothetical protein
MASPAVSYILDQRWAVSGSSVLDSVQDVLVYIQHAVSID